MSYLKFKEYKIVLTESLRIIRNCSGCGCKSTFVSSNCFRINANGSCIDVWLIYQCEKCKHTYNLSIYDRIKPHRIKQDEYLKLLANDSDLAFEYGTNSHLMRQNKAEIDWKNVNYKIVGVQLAESIPLTQIIIRNPYAVKVRTDKVLSEIMGRSRQEIRKMVIDKTLHFSNKNLGDVLDINLLI